LARSHGQGIVNNDPIEVVRAALSALTFTQSEEMLPAHVNRLGSLSARLGGADCASALRVLEQLREAQHLGNGYWVPTPTRVVQIPGQRLIISALPTSELIRGLGNTRHSIGVGRIAEGSLAISLPQEDFDQWLGRIRRGGRFSFASAWTRATAWERRSASAWRRARISTRS
jgi:hypothetical protein